MGVMAGGMTRRGAAKRPTLAERVAFTKAQAAARLDGELPADIPPLPAEFKHCWVNDHRHGRVPALLLGWRQHEGAWMGRVLRPIVEDGSWVIVEEWLTSDFLTPA